MNPSKIEFREFVLESLAQFEPRLVLYVTRLSNGNEDRARDIVQHAFLKLCEQDIDQVRDRVGPWLFRVCRNRVIDEARRHTPNAELDHAEHRADASQCDPKQLAESADLAEYVQQLVGQLSVVQREVIELWSHGLSHEEISQVMEKKPGAVRGILHRALQALKADPQISQWIRESGSGAPAANANPSNERASLCRSANH